MPEPDCYLRYRKATQLSCYTEFYVGKIPRRAARASRGFKMVLFTERRETFVGGTGALVPVIFAVW